MCEVPQGCKLDPGGHPYKPIRIFVRRFLLIGCCNNQSEFRFNLHYSGSSILSCYKIILFIDINFYEV